MMKEALQQENTLNLNINNQPVSGNIFVTTNAAGHKPTVIFATSNTHKQLFELNNSSRDNNNNIQKSNKLFTTNKGKKIFNIVKEPNPNFRRKSVRIIYKNEDDYNTGENYQYEYSENEEKEENYAVKEEYYEEREHEHALEHEEEHKIDDGNDNIFDSSYPTFLNIFK